MALGTISAASASTSWQDNHPRRAEVINRVHKQNMRITQEHHEGRLTVRQAMLLRAHDRTVFHQEQRDARFHDGHITKMQQHRLNRELNKNSRKIGR
ncbi:MAG: hypothetical protein KGJ78_01250 [Alphaproteobacteria bacterium]|nr:hypothetical protein [Alphaproteobacteria bacterium]